MPATPVDEKLRLHDFTILLITEGTSYINTTIKERLKEAGFPVMAGIADRESLDRIGLKANVLFLYASPKLLDKQSILQKIRNKAVEMDVPIFILAQDPVELAHIQAIISPDSILRDFVRPIDFGEMTNIMKADLFGLGRLPGPPRFYSPCQPSDVPLPAEPEFDGIIPQPADSPQTPDSDKTAESAQTSDSGQPADSNQPAGLPPAEPIVRKKILAVDDSGTVLRSIINWLGNEYAVTVANSGFKAIRAICKDRPDLVLLDYEMPVCDGPQLLRMIQSEADYENLPIIFLTGRNDRNSILQIMSYHPAGYLLKSSGAETVKSAIRKFFDAGNRG